MNDAVRKFDVFDTVLSKEVWETKYRFQGNDKKSKDDGIRETMQRVAYTLLPDVRGEQSIQVVDMMCDGVLVPAGRILSGAGTGNRVTMMNCYVMKKMDDSLTDIMQTLSESSLTMQQGGGIGTDFSTLRPHKARLKRTGSSSSGPMPFMDMWDAMCKTIMSAGHRRGAMMATMSIDHPNIVDFITAKHTKDRLKNFNVSVLVSDAFMQCLKEGGHWPLVHPSSHVDWTDEERANKKFQRPLTNGKEGYEIVYQWDLIPARELWNLIMKSSYEYSEPGVIFIDRINNLNNLRNVETIRCTNPCGEQPLPPYGACDLGHINLARLIDKPYTPNANIDWGNLGVAVEYMVDMLDSVIDTTLYPLKEQEDEMKFKRRIGLGITGLADSLSMMGFRYGDEQAVKWTEMVMRRIAIHAYRRSSLLARDKGPAPAFNAETFNWTFLESLEDDVLTREVNKFGLRNCVLLTVAPTGTTSAFYGNVSSGCEPTFSHRYTRKVRQPDDSYKEFTEYSYSVRFWAHIHDKPLEIAYEYLTLNFAQIFPTVNDLTVEDHINMQAAVQKYVDASVSKTVNCPKDITFEKFQDVYLMAWNKGCKGCTTYRESEVRGSILVSATKPDAEQPVKAGDVLDIKVVSAAEPTSLGLPPDQRAGPRSSAAALAVELASKARPKALEGRTYKIKWPQLAAATYVTINHNDLGEPQEVFISSKNSQYTEWATALSVMISKLLKVTKDPIMVAQELKQINLSLNPAWSDGVFYGSIIAQIGAHLQEHAEEFSDMSEMANYTHPEQFIINAIVEKNASFEIGTFVGHSAQCTACGSRNVSMKEGCATCNDCGQSNCN